MNAERLREVASLMRERAEKATPGPWHHESNFGRIPASVVHAAPGVLRGQGRDLPITADTFGRDGRHIASWHPEVALAVADMLDAAASNLNGGRPCSSAALAVADAYLGGNR